MVWRVLYGASLEKRPTAAEGPEPGDARPLNQKELRALRKELQQAIELFKARPPEVTNRKNRIKKLTKTKLINALL